MGNLRAYGTIIGIYGNRHPNFNEDMYNGFWTLKNTVSITTYASQVISKSAFATINIFPKQGVNLCYSLLQKTALETLPKIFQNALTILSYHRNSAEKRKYRFLSGMRKNGCRIIRGGVMVKIDFLSLPQTS